MLANLVEYSETTERPPLMVLAVCNYAISSICWLMVAPRLKGDPTDAAPASGCIDDMLAAYFLIAIQEFNPLSSRLLSDIWNCFKWCISCSGDSKLNSHKKGDHARQAIIIWHPGCIKQLLIIPQFIFFVVRSCKYVITSIIWSCSSSATSQLKVLTFMYVAPMIICDGLSRG